MPKSNKIILLIIIYFIILNGPAFSIEDIRINDSIDSFKLGSHLEFFEDIQKNITIDEIRKEEFLKRFRQNDSETLSFFFTSSAYWVRFNLIKDLDNEREYLLELDNPLLSKAELYIADPSGKIEHSLIKLTDPFNSRKIAHRNFVFPVRLSRKGRYEFFMRIESDNLILLNPVLWTSRERFQGKAKNEHLLFGIFAGAIIIMVLYNLFFFISIKDSNYFYYIVLIFAIGFYQITLLGLSFEYIWPDWPLLDQRAAFFLLGTVLFSGVLFARDFLKVREFMPRYNAVFLLMLGISFIYTLASAVSHIKYLSFAGNLIPLIVIFAVFVPSINSIRVGYKPAGYFICALIVLSAGTLLLILRNFGVMPQNIFTEHTIQVSTIFSAALFSLALADRINLIMKEKDEAEAAVVKTRRSALESLEKTDKLKEQFILNISHDLREPLNEIIALAEEMINDPSLPAGNSISENLSGIMLSAKKFRNFLNNIIDYSKLNAGDLKLHLKAVDFYEVVNIVLFFSNDLAKNGSLELVNEADEDIPPVYVDENRIYLVMFNIIENAIRYGRPGKITVKAEKEGDFLKVFTEFKGSGHYEDMISLFNNSGAETNPNNMLMGLIISKKIIELHGGTIVFNSQEASKALFLFTLPIYRSEKIISANKIDPVKGYMNKFFSPESSGSDIPLDGKIK